MGIFSYLDKLNIDYYAIAAKVCMWWEAVSGHAETELPAWVTVDHLPPVPLLLAALTVICIVRFLQMFSSPEVPRITVNEKSDKSRMRILLDGVRMLQQPYRPPPFWGRSGHVQTAAYGLLGHATLKRTADKRSAVKLPDGTTVTFDIFEAIKPHPTGREVTLCLTPGIANSSESNYIRTCVHFAQERGYRCVVLNHLGALADVQLTGNRIFSYGGVEELTAMMNFLYVEYPQSRFISVGFSMGGNITTQYLIQAGEKERSRLLTGLSVGQGYSATNSTALYHDWENGRRAYNYIITENMKRLLRRNYSQAVAPHVASGLVDEQRLWSATSIVLLDEVYSRRVAGFDSLENFYDFCSCLPHLNKLKVPTVFLNAEDDPIIPHTLWHPVQKLCSERDDMGFVLTRHGGHLGFLEGSSLCPNSVTWLDRFIVDLADEAVNVYWDSI